MEKRATVRHRVDASDGAKSRSMRVSLAHHRGEFAVAAVGSNHDGRVNGGGRGEGERPTGLPAAWAVPSSKNKQNSGQRPVAAPANSPMAIHAACWARLPHCMITGWGQRRGNWASLRRPLGPTGNSRKTTRDTTRQALQSVSGGGENGFFPHPPPPPAAVAVLPSQALSHHPPCGDCNRRPLPCQGSHEEKAPSLTLLRGAHTPWTAAAFLRPGWRGRGAWAGGGRAARERLAEAAATLSVAQGLTGARVDRAEGRGWLAAWCVSGAPAHRGGERWGQSWRAAVRHDPSPRVVWIAWSTLLTDQRKADLLSQVSATGGRCRQPSPSQPELRSRISTGKLSSRMGGGAARKGRGHCQAKNLDI